MKSDDVPFRPLREIELEVEAEMREWGRQRLEPKLQQQAGQHGRVFPPKRTPPVARLSRNHALGDGGGPSPTKGGLRL